jgi:hypothetical protein
MHNVTLISRTSGLPTLSLVGQGDGLLRRGVPTSLPLSPTLVFYQWADAEDSHIHIQHS